MVALAKLVSDIAQEEGSLQMAAAPPGDSSNGPVRGAAPGAVQRRYAEKRVAGHFACFDGGNTFSSFEVVNDDYCDCSDGSDEPGTSACAGLLAGSFTEAQSPGSSIASSAPGFSCAWALEESTTLVGHGPQDVVRLGAVNDGICDCCGGEDEWDGTTTCPDRCAEAAAAEKAEESRALEGSRAREALVKRAASLKDAARFSSVSDGGPDNVFIAAAADGCLSLDDGDFRFEVCLFEKVTQKDKKGKKWAIGKNGAWSTSLWEDGSQRKDYSKLIMDNGEHCAPAGHPRRAEILFECASKPALLSVQEAQMCVYTFRMQTPAACHPLHIRGA